MKSVIKITSRILTAYFIMLPALFGYHTVQHQHGENTDHGDGYEITKPASNCDLCDLYHSQVGIVDSATSYKTNSFPITSQHHYYTHLFKSVENSIHLRGPPNV